MKWPCAILVGVTGCSSAPVADTLDWLRPGYAAPDRPANPALPGRPLPPNDGPPIRRDPLDRPALPGPPDDAGAPPLPPPPQ